MKSKTLERTLAFLDAALEELEMTEYGENIYSECPNCGAEHGICDEDEGD